MMELERTRRRFVPNLWISLPGLFVGIMIILNVADSPRFETYRGLDVFRLVVAGVFIGGGLVMLVQSFAFHSHRSEDKEAAAKSGRESNLTTSRPNQNG